MALTKSNARTAYLSNGFHQEVCYWHALLKEMDMWPIFLASIVKRSPIDLGFTDASGIVSEGVWLDPNSDGASYVWRLLWPDDIAKDLVSFRKPHGRITNSDLELAALVLHEAISPLVSHSSAWRAPTTGSDNTPTVSWTFKEADYKPRCRQFTPHTLNDQPHCRHHPLCLLSPRRSQHDGR